MKNQNTLVVWDPLVRGFHWLLAGAFVTAYLSAEESTLLHSYAGYCIVSLLLARVLWGYIGSRHARFSDFVVSPKKLVAYLKTVVQGNPARYLGHNPAGAAMILALMVSLSMTAVTGMITLGIEEHSGPLAGWVQAMGWHDDDVVEELHEFFANLTVLLVLFHIAGVVVESLRHKENLVKAMITGRKHQDLNQ